LTLRLKKQLANLSLEGNNHTNCPFEKENKDLPTEQRNKIERGPSLYTCASIGVL
jgi:hypothetical protein